MRLKKITVMILAFIMVLSMATTAFAAPYDFTHKTDDAKQYSLLDVASTSSVLLDIVSNQNSYLIEGDDGSKYVFNEVKALIDSGMTFNEAIAELDPVEEDLQVEEVSAIDANTISVTFDNEETVEVTLETALVHGQTEVTFLYEEVEYTATLTEAWVDPAAAALEAATAAVEKAEESLLEADLADAQELVTALEASDAKTLLQARINSVQLTINGIVNAVNTANTEVKLHNILSVKPFVNYDAENITAYDAAITGPYTTIAQIQTVIDTVNATAYAGELGTLVTTATSAVVAAEADPDGDVAAPGTGTLIEAAQEAIDALPAEITEAQATAASTVVTIKADLQERLEDVKIVAPVLAATNQIELLPALQNNFDRVNEDLIATYEIKLLVTDITVAAIQGKIDAANLLAAQTAVTTAETNLTAADVATAQVLVNNLPEDVAPATTKAGLQDRLDVVTALIAVADATTEAELLTALENEVLALTDVNAAAIADYKTLVDGGEVIATATNVQDNVVTAGNTAALATAVSDVETNFQTYDATLAADQTAALAELNRLAEVSADVDSDTILAELIEDYIFAINTEIRTWTIETYAEKAQAIQAQITTVNAGLEEAQRLAAVNAATTSAEMRTALTAVAIAESDAYVDLTSQEKLEVAELVLVARDAITTPVADEFAATGDVTSAISTATSARTTFLGNVNGATTISGMITALDVVEFPEFQALSDLEQVDAAEAVLVVLEALQAETPAAEFKTISEIKTAAGL